MIASSETSFWVLMSVGRLVGCWCVGLSLFPKKGRNYTSICSLLKHLLSLSGSFGPPADMDSVRDRVGAVNISSSPKWFKHPRYLTGDPQKMFFFSLLMSKHWGSKNNVFGTPSLNQHLKLFFISTTTPATPFIVLNINLNLKYRMFYFILLVYIYVFVLIVLV